MIEYPNDCIDELRQRRETLTACITQLQEIQADLEKCGGNAPETAVIANQLPGCTELLRALDQEISRLCARLEMASEIHHMPEIYGPGPDFF